MRLGDWRLLQPSTVLLSERVQYLSVVWFEWGVFPQFRVCVFIVDIVTDPDELLSPVGAGDEDDCHPHGVALRNQPRVRGVGL